MLCAIESVGRPPGACTRGLRARGMKRRCAGSLHRPTRRLWGTGAQATVTVLRENGSRSVDHSFECRGVGNPAASLSGRPACCATEPALSLSRMVAQNGDTAGAQLNWVGVRRLWRGRCLFDGIDGHLWDTGCGAHVCLCHLLADRRTLVPSLGALRALASLLCPRRPIPASYPTRLHRRRAGTRTRPESRGICTGTVEFGTPRSQSR